MGFFLTTGVGEGVVSSSSRVSSSRRRELGREFEEVPEFRRTTPEVFLGDELNCSLSLERSLKISSLVGRIGRGSV